MPVIKGLNYEAVREFPRPVCPNYCGVVAEESAETYGDAVIALFIMSEKLQKLLENEGYTVTPEVVEELKRFGELLAEGGTTDISGVLKWLEERRKNNTMTVTEVGIKDLLEWKVDPETGNIVHASGRFFQIVGVKTDGAEEREVSSWTQPMIKQNECGILGILT
ncbi:MAG: NDP-hexose 2,3-dehydratase family protein, partial [bacterium]|nr:NDP-hexose 2,3-dehydratase family protein [bacterium]